MLHGMLLLLRMARTILLLLLRMRGRRLLAHWHLLLWRLLLLHVGLRL